ncbi:unnamed protein product [Symbiodinium natans]|uniref:Uncharacterized protein n=1 Tax=Symbiodinium natans TaxID=878477 RepID=A0A812N9E6_9DINO|nr:unnamed protein product [Symbiodinium natans]
MKLGQLLAPVLLEASANTEVQRLIDAPSSVPLRCRLRKEWDFDRCCHAFWPQTLKQKAPGLRGMNHMALPASPDSLCFRLQTPEGLSYAQKHCCDDGKGAWDHGRVLQAAVRLAVCLLQCSCHGEASFNCGCEKSYLQEVEHIAGDLKVSTRNRFWHIAKRWGAGNRSAHWSNRSEHAVAGAMALDCVEENQRGGLRILEHLLLSFAGASAMQSTMALDILKYALDQHQLSSKKQSRRLKRVARRKLHPSRLVAPPDGEPVHIAMITSIGEPVNGRRSLATIRSALFHAKEKPLHFHFFVDQAGREDTESVLRDWLEPELHKKIAQITWWGPTEFDRISKVLHARVPEKCLEGVGSWKGEYGSPGWMRLFPQEIFSEEPEHLIWTDAGDFLFFADPAKLLDEHLQKVGRSRAVATYPSESVFPVQVFALKKMRQAQWSSVAEALVRRLWPLDPTHLCYRGEGTSMEEMSKQHADLFAPILGRWAHEPVLPNFVSTLVDVTRKGGYVLTPSVWDDREHPGLVDPTQAFIFCPSVAELFTHFFATWLHPPTFSLEIAQLWVHSAKAAAEQAAMLRLYPCGAPVLGMHLIRLVGHGVYTTCCPGEAFPATRDTESTNCVTVNGPWQIAG